MGQPDLEVADIFRVHGPAWRAAQRGHLSLGQLKVMSAIEQCRSAALGGHVLRCGGCGVDQVAYNSCRNRHCPKCQSSAAKRWLDARQADLLPVEYYHVVFTLPASIADIAYQNKAALYGLLFDIAAETLLRIAADPKHLGASIGATLVLHDRGTHHELLIGEVPILTSAALGTERDFGRLVERWSPRDEARVLIGGLGFGATTAGVLERVGPRATVFVAERLSTGRSEATTRLLLQLELVGLSRLGSNPLGVLRDNIPGYRLLREDADGVAGPDTMTP